MQIKVHGKHMDVGEALTTHVNTRLDEAVSKYSVRPTEASATFYKDRHEFCCDLSAHMSTGLTAQAKGRAGEVYDAFEGAVDRMEKQLRRYKRRLKDHHHKRDAPIEALQASAYILDREAEFTEENEPETLQPVIVAEMETKVQSLSVGEAVMHMELSGAPLLVFRNTTHGGVNVVYLREDGNIGWIDPRNSAAS